MTRPTALIIAPGRGTYNKAELGYLKRHHEGEAALFAGFDAQRAKRGQDPITALDGAARYSVAKFTRGDNASGLIYACSYADFRSLAEDKVEVVAVTGNSMGWYTALACAGAVSGEDGFRIVNTMGTLMQDQLIGGQILYPFVDEDWQEIPGKREELLALTEDIPGLFLSISLGGMLLFGGMEDALAAAMDRLPPLEAGFPLRLHNHAAFHTPLQAPVSALGKSELPASLFTQPRVPLIDGRGHIWQPVACHLNALWGYTFGHQVTEPYDFTAAIRTGIREFAPDQIIILGPGTTLGGAVAQVLVSEDWRGVTGKAAFKAAQERAPVVVSLGMEGQRSTVS